MNRAPKDQTGLALGAWGAVQATAAGVAVALGGILRDVMRWPRAGSSARLGTPASGYAFVYAIEIVLLAATVVAMMALVRSEARRSAAAHGVNNNHHQWSAS